MTHPLEKLTIRKRLFWMLLILTMTLSILMSILGKPLNTTAAPFGIVSFEISGSPAKARAILDSWDLQAKVNASFIQGLDFLYLCVYSTTLGLVCLMAGSVLRTRHWPLANLASPMAWGLWLAAAFDAAENIALGVMLLSQVQSPWPQIALVCAYVKFGLLFAGLVFAFYGLAARLVPQAGSYAAR